MTSVFFSKVCGCHHEDTHTLNYIKKILKNRKIVLVIYRVNNCLRMLVRCVGSYKQFIVINFLQVESNLHTHDEIPWIGIFEIKKQEYQGKKPIFDLDSAVVYLPAGESDEDSCNLIEIVKIDNEYNTNEFVVVGSTQEYIRRWIVASSSSNSTISAETIGGSEAVYECLQLSEAEISSSSRSISISFNGTRVASCEGTDIIVRTEELHTMAILRTSNSGNLPQHLPCNTAFVSADPDTFFSNTTLISVYEDGTLGYWDVMRSECLHTIDSNQMSFQSNATKWFVNVLEKSSHRSGNEINGSNSRSSNIHNGDGTVDIIIGREDGRLWLFQLLEGGGVSSQLIEKGSLDVISTSGRAKNVNSSPTRVISPVKLVALEASSSSSSSTSSSSISTSSYVSIVAMTSKAVICVSYASASGRMKIIQSIQLHSLFNTIPISLSGVIALIHSSGDRYADQAEDIRVWLGLLSTFDHSLSYAYTEKDFTSVKYNRNSHGNSSSNDRLELDSWKNTNDNGDSHEELDTDEGEYNQDCHTSSGEQELSFFMSNKEELPLDSPLLRKVGPSLGATSSMHLGATGLPTSLIGRGAWDKPAFDKTSGKVLDLPVTFTTKIKSSGYGQTPTSNKRNSRSSRSRTSIKGGRRGSTGDTYGHGSGERILSYPIDCGLLVNYQEHNTFTPKANNQNLPISNVEFAASASHLALTTSSAETAVSQIKLPVGRYKGETVSFMGHDARVNSVRCSLTKSLLLSASADGTARIWSPGRSDSASVVFSHKRHQPGSVSRGLAQSLSTITTSVRPTATGTGLLSGTMATQGDNVRNQPFGSEILSAQFFHQDEFVILATKGNVLMYSYEFEEYSSNDLIRMQSQGRYRLVSEWNLGSQQVSALSAMNSTRSHLIIAGTSDKRLLILDAVTSKTIRTVSAAHERPIHSIALSSPSVHVQKPSSAYNVFASCAADGLVNIWDIRCCTSVARFSNHINRREKIQIALSPCLRYVATGSEDKSCRMVDLRSGRELHKLTGHKDVVSGVAFNPLYPQLATCSYDGSVRFYVDDGSFISTSRIRN